MDSDDEKLDGIVKIETLESEEITELNTLSDNEEEFHLGNKNGEYFKISDSAQIGKILEDSSRTHSLCRIGWTRWVGSGTTKRI